jgi:hypothetical protein
MGQPFIPFGRFAVGKDQQLGCAWKRWAGAISGGIGELSTD